jgi:hypothetical protein
MNISQQFAPPFKLISPYFIIGIFVLSFSTFLLFGMDISTAHSLNSSTLAWVHIFLLGFVMMIIFGAMAQLVPVVLEVGHFAVDLYYIIYPLLFIGTVLMGIGFYYFPTLLPFGGVIAFVAFSIFLFETFLTILKVKKLNFIITTVLIANIFLLFGLIIGIVLALGYSGVLDVEIYKLIKAHVFLVLVGYVGITIMGMSLVLLPMFWLSHSFSWIYVKSALTILCFGVLLIVLSSFINIKFIEYSGYILSFTALILYFFQIFIIMVFSYFCLLISIIMGIIYIFNPYHNLLLTLSWLAIFGFITFVITGHMYKIVPFLVWFERFSPFVGKKKVPMLSDMIPVKSANMQFFFSTLGVMISAIGILFGVDSIFKSGISLLSIGAIFLLKDILYMIRFK